MSYYYYTATTIGVLFCLMNNKEWIRSRVAVSMTPSHCNISASSLVAYFESFIVKKLDA